MQYQRASKKGQGSTQEAELHGQGWLLGLWPSGMEAAKACWLQKRVGKAKILASVTLFPPNYFSLLWQKPKGNQNARKLVDKTSTDQPSGKRSLADKGREWTQRDK